MPDLKMADAASAKSNPVPGVAAPVLAVQDLQAWYGESHILHGINFNVNAGEVVTLLGRNGAGKTTTLKSIMGIIGKRTGSIRFDDKDIIRTSSDKIARMGVAFCPEERGIFASLDVRENLMLPPIVRSGGLTLDQIFELFPNLKERLNSQGTKLSGGEQQMLAIARILRTGARFLMLDEPTEGLAPVIIQQIGHTISRLKSEGFTILLVEQNFRFASTVADRFLHRRARQGHRRLRHRGVAGQHGQASYLSRRLKPWRLKPWRPKQRKNNKPKKSEEETDMKNKISALLLGTALALTSANLAFAQDKVVKIGALSDQSGLYADLGGPGSTLAAQMAVEDSGMTAKGWKIDIISGDHLNKPDVGVNIARQWFDVDKVDVIVDVPNSGVALAVSNITKEKNGILLDSGAGSSDLTNAQCTPNTIHWTYDTYTLAHGTGSALAKSRRRYLVLPDRRLCLRCRARTRHHGGGAGGGRQDRSAGSSIRSAPRTSRRSCSRPRPPRPRSSASPMPAPTPPPRSSRRRSSALTVGRPETRRACCCSSPT